MNPWSWNPPSDARVAALRAVQAGLGFSYNDVGATRAIERGREPAGFNYDETRARLGTGERDFAAACAAVRAWRMFPAPWTRIDPPHAPIGEGTVVAMRAHALGFWWLNACRIVYLVDEPAGATGPGSPRRFGFAYGTLPAHIECGEERFTVELHADGSVWYDLRAFSHPRYWMVRLGRPLARRLQWRFAHDSVASMRQAAEAARNSNS